MKYLDPDGLKPRGAILVERGGDGVISNYEMEKWIALVQGSPKEAVGGAGEQPKSNLESEKLFMKKDAINFSERAREISVDGKPITDDQIKEWSQLSVWQRFAMGGLAGFAAERNIKYSSAKSYLRIEGVSQLGEERLRPVGNAKLSEEQMLEWSRLSPEQRKEIGGPGGFAKMYNVRYSTVMNSISNKGLTFRASQKMSEREVKPITTHDIKEWANFSPEQRQQMGGIVGYAKTKKIKYDAAVRYLKVDGLSPIGKARLSNTRDITSPEQRKGAGGVEGNPGDLIRKPPEPKDKTDNQP